ncbi:cadherin repeat domain-containing protein [Pseudorhodoferax sp. Leaf265]|uniref:cadherin repeat domain-containing protein n=1 Tax=Pseudorhodoferax sp. Leaf265 TaxID=1736315 RepID=UPI00138F7E2D|nr:cadherin repeat domain-containing protein [Pseudorhodoferax sp. Leaf265]
MPENAANGTVVGITAQALDPDGTATVTYSLTDNAGGRFTIDASTGVVSVADGSLLDHETASSHQITVLATSSDGSTSSANFTIGLADVNEAPVGAVTDVNAAANSVAENATNGTVVGVTAQATDPDGTATVTYSLTDNAGGRFAIDASTGVVTVADGSGTATVTYSLTDNAGGRFAIDASTGVVTVADGSLLNYEAAASHQITVLATSSDGSTSSASFTINLTDVNEAPVGAVTDVNAAANQVAENAANGTAVGITAQAVDPDGTATVSYSLTDNAGGRFTIDANTGVVTVADGSLLDFEAASSHQITVLAASSDGSTSSTNFTIALGDVNEAPVGAVADVDAAANTVAENATNGTVVGITTQAIDPDGTATVSYSLTDNAGGRFAIDASTGVVTVADGSLLNYEAASSHQITVLATSSDGSTSSANFTIGLTDVNEAPVGAVSDVDGATNTVAENATNGTVVGITAQATDPDGTASVSYSLTDNAGGRFTIDASTGVVTVADGSLLNYEAAASHQITVLATSSDGSTSSANFTIGLTDVNEAPVGAVTDVDATANSVAENAVNGTVVGVTAQALDPDSTASVTYSLTDNAGGRFAIDANTGVVTVADGSLLDYETAASHQITVLATSSDGSTASANFTIGLADVNEAPVGAVTDGDAAANTVAENAANGTAVGITAQALDPDGTATVSYSLTDSAGGRFTIDASTGVVTVADGALLNYEAAASHQITVLATSSDGSTSSANFTIALSDVNEAPVGAVTDVDAAANTVPENAANGTVVGVTAQAVDPDGTATVTYSLSDNAGGRFAIDANTGVVTVADGSLLNYEAASSHQITVLATSSDGSTSSANFTIALGDVNEAPVGAVGDVDGAANTVPENAANGTVVGITAQAVDPDGTASVTYSLTDNAGGRFAIDASTGVVTVADGSLLNYEAASSHQITVLATSSDGSTSSANFTVGLTDVNEAPVGAVTDVDGAANTVPENAANGTVVGVTAQALDPDGTATVTYSLSDNAGGRFAIDASTGVVTVANASLLDFEAAASHQITVLATSSDGSTSSASFTVSLGDVNEAPVGAITDMDAASNTVAENATNGTVVGITAQALDPDGTATVSYSLTDNAGGRFAIDASTGVVTVADGSLLNYEAASSHQITVRATSSDGSTSSANFTIGLADVNEAPVGAVTDVDAAANTVPENAANGTVVGVTAQAIDLDGTATVTYSLSNDAGGRFAIDASTGVITVGNGSLLDHETASSHQITVLATSSDGSTSSATFTIALGDLNEAPVGAVTDVDGAANTVPENAANGSAVGVTAQALDPDGTATVTYSLTNDAGGRFTIDASTGVVTVADGSLLDHETASSHQVTVLATSSDGSSSSANFTVNLADVNEAPVGAVTDVDAAANTVPENAATGTVAGITAQALDPDGTASVSYNLTDNAGGRFTIDASTGVVTVANGSLLNYESATSHQITVLATSSDGSTSSANFTIGLTDVNEAPVGAVTDVDPAANTVPENAANGTVVGVTAQALDPDGTASVTYSLSDNAGGRFAIDASTGAVTVADGSLLDHETASSHQITVLATSSDGSTSSATFTIALGDVNEAPVGAVADVDAAANTVPENATTGTVVGITAQALDPDGTATVSYSLSDNAGGRFVIDASTGVVTVANGSLLNYESAGSHQITVLATSSDGSTSSANFTVNLADVNEAPVGAVTDVDAAANTVAENAANGTVVGITAQATDPDGTATVSYSLSNNAGGRFAIDASTGVVTVADGSLLNHEAATSHQITVLATSSDGSTSSTAFTIALGDVNEAPVGAVTDVDAAANTVPENATTGTVVGITAQAIDPDGTAMVTYSLTDNAGGRFTIDASTGVVTVADGSLLDYETASSHQITVLATSSDGSTSSMSFTVALGDANEAPVGPVTDVDAAANTVPENAANGTAVGITAHAIDPDGTASVAYSLTDNAGGRFAIDANTGVVTVANASLLDHESATSHQITVRATSSDGSTSSATFTIALGDVNEAPLGAIADVDPAANQVPENAATGTPVGITAQAVDPDGTATVSYTLSDDAGGRFTIDPATGVVTVADGSLLDYEGQAQYQITVLATSSDGSSSSLNFTVQLTDVNEVPVGAISDIDPAPDTVPENAATGTPVGITVQAVDPDGTATVRYSLSDDAGGRFAIDADTGLVTVADGSLLDYEGATSHQITVLATSSDGSTSSASFTVALSDVNEAVISPVVDTDPAPNRLPENATTGTPVGITAFARDPDAGATVSYALLDDAGGRFAIDASTGVVTVADGSLLDYESATTHGIVVRATSSDGSTTDTAFTIALADVNEFAVGPSVDTDPAPNRVDDNAATGATVGVTVQAVDADGSNNTVRYSLSDDAGGRFAIDAQTGVVTVADGTRLQDADGFTIKVLATSSDGSSSETAFNVAVRNTNVQAPVITSAASVAVPENSVDVLQVTASDADSPASALVYSIVGGADAARFSIDAQTGALRFTTAPDVEIPADANGDNLYDVRVRVSDGRQSSEQQLAVQVTPVNDNAPRFTTPGGVVEVPENSTAVVRVQAVDADLPAETLRYSIVGGADAARFTIDAQTGALRFVQAPDREAPVDADGDNDYAVVVGVSDGLQSASLALTVRVRDVVDGGGLPGGTVQVSVPEQQTAVTTVQASGTGGQPLQYALAGGADAALFTIDAATGRLAFRAPPLFMAPRDADGDNLYEVLVRVSDGERTGDYRVLVTVTGNPVVQPNPVPAAPVPGPTPPVAVPVPPNLPASGAGQSLGSDPAAGEAGATDEGGLQFAGGADMVHADHVPGTRPAPAVLLAPATQQPLPADLLLRVQWRQSDYHAAWGDIGLPDLLLPDLLRSEPVDASAQTNRGPRPDALPVVADTAEEGRDGTLQASAALDQALAGGIAIGLGAAFWASRGSALLASLLAMSPAWTSMDPLPVLNRRQRGPRDPRAQQPFGDAREDNGDGTEPEDARRKDEETVAEDKQ